MCAGSGVRMPIGSRVRDDTGTESFYGRVHGYINSDPTRVLVLWDERRLAPSGRSSFYTSVRTRDLERVPMPEPEAQEPAAPEPAAAIEPGTDMRPSWPSTWMTVAGVLSRRATCPRLHNGAVVVDKDNQLLVTGFNGAPRGQDHCEKVGCIIEGGHCVRALHAESNCITQAARTGSSLHGGSLYTLYRPCIRCSLLIAQTGLRFVFYLHEYDTDSSGEEVRRLFKSSDIGMFSIEGW